MPKPRLLLNNASPIELHHRPALADIAAEALLYSSGAVFIDCTAGSGGGHIKALLTKTDKPLRILALDIDPNAVETLKTLMSERPEVIIVEGDYAELETLANTYNFHNADGIIADFGPSLDQILNTPGFSHSLDAPLDMRYTPKKNITAADVLNNYSQVELKRIFREIGEDRLAGRIAAAVVAHRPIATTAQLTNIIQQAADGLYVYKTLARIYMALRVVVNDELNSIERMLPQALRLLGPAGRLVFITWDSNEDRLVKDFLRRMERPCVCPPHLPCVCGAQPKLQIITRHPIRPTAAEIAAVPHSRSARLRIAQKLP